MRETALRSFSPSECGAVAKTESPSAKRILTTTRHPPLRERGTKNEVSRKVHAKRGILARKPRYPKKKALERGEAVELELPRTRNPQVASLPLFGPLLILHFPVEQLGIRATIWLWERTFYPTAHRAVHPRGNRSQGHGMGGTTRCAEMGHGWLGRSSARKKRRRQNW